MTDEFSMIEWDGKLRLTCTCCSRFLRERGMIEIADEIPFAASEVPKLPPAVMRVYRYAPGVSQDDCKAAVQGRHHG